MSDMDTPKKEEEVDLGQLFGIIGDAIKGVFRFIGNLFYNLFVLVMACLIFLKKNIFILAGAALLGYIYGSFKEYTETTLYQGEAIVKPNFQL